MREEGEAVEHRHVAHAEHQRDETRCRRHGREPEKSHRQAEDDGGRRRHRQQHEDDDRDRPQRIDDREHVAPRPARHQPSRRERAEDVRQSDGAERHAADPGIEAAVGEELRQMAGDEGELETAGEKAEHQQNVGRLRESLLQRAAERLRAVRGAGVRARCGRRRPQREGERNNDDGRGGEDDQRGFPSDRVDEHRREGRTDELAERARRRAEAQPETALLRRQQLREGAQHDIERTSGESEADHHAAGDVHQDRIARHGHEREAGHVKQRSADEHARRAETVGDGAGEGLADSPEQLLQREGQREDAASPAELVRDRLQEKAEHRSRPEAKERDRCAGQRDQKRRAPGGRGGKGRCAHGAENPEVCATVSRSDRRRRQQILMDLSSRRMDRGESDERADQSGVQKVDADRGRTTAAGASRRQSALASLPSPEPCETQ